MANRTQQADASRESLNVLVSIPTNSNRNPFEDYNLSECSKADLEDANSISAFGSKAAAREFFESNADLLESVGFPSEPDLVEITSNKDDSFIGYRFQKSRSTVEDASSELESILS